MKPDIEIALRELFARAPDVDVVALFGSAATGRMRPNSDCDLYVRLRDGAKWPLGLRLDLASEATAVCRREVDLIVEDESTSVVLRREVASKGRPLYEARPGAWTDLRAAAVLAYMDLEPYLRRIGAAIRTAAVRNG